MASPVGHAFFPSDPARAAEVHLVSEEEWAFRQPGGAMFIKHMHSSQEMQDQQAPASLATLNPKPTTIPFICPWGGSQTKFPEVEMAYKIVANGFNYKLNFTLDLNISAT